MKLEVGMYVRTKWGYICELININDFREPSMKYGVEANYLRDIMFIGDEDISKASNNIMNLIEVGDYVNGEKVEDVILDNKMSRIKTTECSTYFEEDIKSIVTKQEFSQMEYKVDND